MFTGIVREVGTVERVERSDAGARLRVGAALAAGLAEGDSVSVSGACLTVASLPDGAFEADVINQTLVGDQAGAAVDAGRGSTSSPPLRAGEPLGGHFVQGHVDGTGAVAAASDGRVLAPSPDRGAGGASPLPGRSTARWPSTASASRSRGSRDEGLEIALIPETLARTTLGELAPGDRVNLEMDLIARHVERLVQGFAGPERKGNA